MLRTAGIAYFSITIPLLLLVISLSGCASKQPKPIDLQISGQADAELNRDISGRPLSVVLNVYQLRSRQAFARLTFEDFLSGKTDSELLGDDLVNKIEYVMLPGAKESLKAALVPEAEYLGIVAMFRMPASQQWRYLIPGNQMRDKSFWGSSKQKDISIRLHDCHMTVDGVELDLIPGQRVDAPTTCIAPTQPSTPATSSSQASSPIESPTWNIPKPALPLDQIPPVQEISAERAKATLLEQIR